MIDLKAISTIELVRELLRRFDKHVFSECEDSFMKLAREIEDASDYLHEDFHYALERDYPPMTGDGPITERTRQAIIQCSIPAKDAKKTLAQARYQDWKNSQSAEKP